MRLAESKDDGNMYAVKIIDKKALKGEHAGQTELSYLNRIIRVRSTFAMKGWIF